MGFSGTTPDLHPGLKALQLRDFGVSLETHNKSTLYLKPQYPTVKLLHGHSYEDVVLRNTEPKKVRFLNGVQASPKP